MPDLTQRIAENLTSVRRRIADAARVGGRTADAVSLVAVTKYVGLPEIRALLDAGCDRLGESRPQHLAEKVDALADRSIDWHMIGHLQRNKIRRTLPLVQMIHSADNPKMIEAVARIAGQLSIRVPILLEVNISADESKHGFAPEAIEPYLEEVAGLDWVEVRGLMCMAGLEGGPDSARGDFAALRELRDRLQRNCPEAIRLDELSMGMSGDFEVAIEEGATIVRVGSALYEGIGR